MAEIIPGNAWSFLDIDAVSRLRRLPLESRQPMLGNVSGRHQSPHRGSSLEFAEYRKYVQGDDIRRLDWRAYGRTDRYYIKEFEADTNMRLCLVLDTSGSMDFGSGEENRLQFARRILGSLAYLALEQGDAVGLTCVGSENDVEIPPRRHPSHLKLICDAMKKAQPAGETRLADALHDLAETTRQRALVIVCSDFFSDPEKLRSAFQHLHFCHHDVALFHLLGKEEIEFAFDRPMRFADLEGGSPVVTDPQAIADQYNAAFARYLAQLMDAVRDASIDYQKVFLDEDYEECIARFLLRRIA